MTKPIAIGIDIEKAKFDASIKLGEKYPYKKFENTEKGFEELEKWMEKNGVKQAHFCMEATGIYGENLANYLYQRQYIVSVVNPRSIEAFGRSQMRRNKTDKQDARLIAQYCESMNPEKWHPLPEELKSLQELERHLESLKNQHSQQLNRLESQRNTTVIKSTNRILTSIEEEIKEVEKMIKEEIEKNEQLKKNNQLLQTIPAIGQTIAIVILAEIGDITRFDSVRKLDAFAGLSPSQHTSGTSVRKQTRLSKLGNSRLRKALYFPAVSAKQHNPIVKAFCSRLEKKGKVAMSILGAAMRKLLHLVYGVLKHQLPFDPNFLQQKPIAA
jgi:transposase